MKLFLFIILIAFNLFADQKKISGKGFSIDYSVPDGCASDDVKSIMTPLEAEIKNSGATLGKLGSSASATLSGDIVKNQNSWEIDSYLYRYSTYTGGAHSNTSEFSFNYKANTCSSIKLTDVVKISKDKLKLLIIDKLKKTDFQANDSALDHDFENTLNVEDAYFYFLDDYLILAFKEYSIAPYSTGIVRVRFTKSEIQ